MKIKIEKLITVFKCISIEIIVLLAFIFWLNLLIIEPILQSSVESNARSLAATNLSSRNYKYYIFTVDESKKNQTYLQHEYNDIIIKMEYYYYPESYFDFIFIISPKMIESWYVEAYNSKVKEFFPDIDWESIVMNK